jgi:outer membrane protein
MKNLSLILNAVLLVAVGVLFYFHFSAGTQESSSTASTVNPGDLQVAYIKSDSVLKHYEFLEVNRVQLETKTKKLQDEYRNRAMGLQNEITSYQRNQSTMTLSQTRAVEEDLGKKQQNLQMYEQSLSQQLQGDQAKLMEELYGRITAYVKKYGTEKGLQVVLKYDVSSDVLFAGEALDITNDVIKGLNEEYAAEKSGAKAKADSTAVKK